MGRTGQASVEFLVIVGIAFLMTAPLLVIFFKQSEALGTDISANQVDKIASEIRDAADEVYYLGVPSKKTIIVYVPKEVTGVAIYESSIIFNVSTTGGKMEIVKWSVANFSGGSGIEPKYGIRRITAEAVNVDTFGTVAVLLSDS